MNCLRSVAKGIRFDVKKYKNDADIFAVKKQSEQCKNIGAPFQAPVDMSDITNDRSDKKSLTNEKDRIRRLRKERKIYVKGEDISKPVESFQELQQLTSCEIVFQNINKLGFKEPTPVQMQTIPLLLDRRELICCAPTGSGKTLSFLLPLILDLKEPKNCGFRAIILAPTRELAKQTHRECIILSEGTGLRIHLIKNVYLAKKQFGLCSKLKFDILVTTPKRLAFLVQQKPMAININNIQWLVVDECDKLFEKSFREQLAVIYNAVANSNSQVCRALFSATFDKELHSWFELNLDNVVTVIIGRKNRACESVKQKFMFVGSEEGRRMALCDLITSGLDVPVLVFVKNIEKAKTLSKQLSLDGIRVGVIHSEKRNEERDSVIREFREGKIWFLICTELMSRGIDFKGVNIIINYDFPLSHIEYIHRIGRTGRAGRLGEAITFFTEHDIKRCPKMINIMRSTGSSIPVHLLDEFSRKRKSGVMEEQQQKYMYIKRKNND
ncbi:hypothetical protein B4U80_03679 [Leptotrombidium deliense]|uniref:Probable ATP-dependent RNA helicase DDX52 n=1 Tax=Leptotrombidium deliense TaxID=299467 RepID=A0A443SD55_9ACAR|nr:hypothetical protein B4U80_03679 [Leptotrombidium deliense]